MITSMDQEAGSEEAGARTVGIVARPEGRDGRRRSAKRRRHGGARAKDSRIHGSKTTVISTACVT